jgi:hypothetical protein
MSAIDKIRLNPVYQFLIMLVVSLILVAASQILGLGLGAAIIAGIIGIFALIVVYIYPILSLYLIISIAFFLFFVQRVFKLYDLPLGTLIEGLSLATAVILLMKSKLDGAKNIIGGLLLGWLTLNCVEFINPKAVSRVAWFYAFRGVFNITMIYFIAYSTIDSWRDILSLTKFWILLSFLAAIYCLYQEFYGFPDFDMAWINAKEERYNLLFTWGRLRKFSFFSGPTELGLVLTYAILMSFVLFFYVKGLTKWALLGGIGIIIYALLQTGSRTSTILLPVGLGFFTILTFRKEILIIMGIFFVMGTLIILAPTKNASFFVMRTAFEKNEDPSYLVRIANQQKIKPYILGSPFGFGLGSTGDWGRKFSPDTFVGSFPPDSEFVKIAIETGWIGLTVWMVILFLMFRYAISSYFSLKHYETKMLFSIFVSIFYMYIIAQYPQEAFRIPSTTVLFAITVAIIAKIKQLDS